MDEETVNEELDEKEDEGNAAADVDADDVKANQDDSSTDDNGEANQ
jgi:hypothetical protein